MALLRSIETTKGWETTWGHAAAPRYTLRQWANVCCQRSLGDLVVQGALPPAASPWQRRGHCGALRSDGYRHTAPKRKRGHSTPVIIASTSDYFVVIALWVKEAGGTGALRHTGRGTTVQRPGKS